MLLRQLFFFPSSLARLAKEQKKFCFLFITVLCFFSSIFWSRYFHDASASFGANLGMSLDLYVSGPPGTLSTIFAFYFLFIFRKVTFKSIAFRTQP
jgi:hypothetical protein